MGEPYTGPGSGLPRRSRRLKSARRAIDERPRIAAVRRFLHDLPSTTLEPPMTPRQIQLVRESYAAVEPIADTAATIFYRRLFDLDPDLRALFPSDLTAQRRNLMQTLTVVVRNLDRLEGILPAVEALGRRHAGYRVRRDDYETVGAALLDTLGEGLGDAFTLEVRSAWTAAYGVLASVMIAASEGVEDAEAAAA
jgi:nitric oxide dioxygenase